MKSAVETLSPTRVKVTAEVPFDRIAPSLDAAYAAIGSQVNIPGFRRGKVPRTLIDQRFGRAAVLDEALNDAMPGILNELVTENEIKAIGRPDLEITDFTDGEALAFIAEWSVRPVFELPDYKGLAVTVPDATTSDDEVDSEVERLRERFGSLSPVERAVADGDFVVLDLSATVDGAALAEGTASGQSYQVGSDALGLEGLDAALVGLSAGESATLSVPVVQGEHAGKEAEFSVAVTAVRERILPALDDDFAQLASEFDTIAELREELTAQLGRFARLDQGIKAREAVTAALLGLVEVPVPEEYVTTEVTEHLAGEGKDAEDPHGEEVAAELRESLQRQFLLDDIAAAEGLVATEAELSSYLVQQASRYGMAPDAFAQEVIRAGQVPAMLADVVRGKALALVLSTAVITDESGVVVDLEALNAELSGPIEPADGDTIAAAEDDADA